MRLFVCFGQSVTCKFCIFCFNDTVAQIVHTNVTVTVNVFSKCRARAKVNVHVLALYHNVLFVAPRTMQAGVRIVMTM